MSDVSPKAGLTVAKVIIYDIVQQARTSAALSSTDAANCYNSIAHAIALLVFQAFGVPLKAVESILTVFEEMKYFLWTAYGDFKKNSGSTIDLQFQGFCKGIGAAQAGLALNSITMFCAHKIKGHGGHFGCPISNLTGHIAALLFVDDTDLIHINLKSEETKTVAHQSMQDSISNWGWLLIASGGAFKPPKCFYHLIYFCWNTDGSWTYENNEDLEDFNISVPMLDGSQVQIEHAAVDTAKETLGVWTSPVRDSKAALETMQNKADKWISRAKEGTLSRRDVWFLLDRQLWPRVGYGLNRKTWH